MKASSAGYSPDSTSASVYSSGASPAQVGGAHRHHGHHGGGLEAAVAAAFNATAGISPDATTSTAGTSSVSSASV